MPTELQNKAGYLRFLTRSFDRLSRATTDQAGGRPQVSWVVANSAVDGRLIPLDSEERRELEQQFGAVTHRLLLKPGQSVEFDDIFRPASETSGPAYAVKGTYAYQSAVRVALVEETEPDDASDYYS